MRLFIVLLVLSAFVQSAFLPINLCLVLIISRSFVEERSSNLIASFLCGIFLGLLTVTNIGFWALTFLAVSKIVHILRNLPLTNSPRLIAPIALVIIIAVSFLEQVFLGQKMNVLKIGFETLLTIPVYIFIRFWEERFVVKSPTRLKIRN